MCGIVGYVGKRSAQDVLLDGLEKLEYRGYDSAGVALALDGGIRVVKSKGRLTQLRQKLAAQALAQSFCGIGHTRWATHGEPSDVNSHPHSTPRVSIVHNGIIENYGILKERLIAKGYTFESETDTEVLVKLIDSCYTGDPLRALQEALAKVRGSYALAVLFRDRPDTIFAVKRESPLIVGWGEGENFVASDIPALLKYTRRYSVLEEGDMAVCTAEGIRFYNEFAEPVQRPVLTADWDMEAAEKGGYPHFMLKEIFEQPKVISDCLAGRVDEEKGMVVLPELDGLPVPSRLRIIACGTSYHAGMWGQHLLENWARMPVVPEIASEFRYRNVILEPDDMVLVISQSGETADTLAALRLAKEKGCIAIALCNVVGSSIPREADAVIYTQAGPEISVASTKAMCSQMVIMALMALYYGQRKGLLDAKTRHEALAALHGLPKQIEDALPAMRETAQMLSPLYASAHSFFYLGRGHAFPLALEGALKLKEISYIHAEGYASGEMKHGPIALIEPEFPTFALAFNDALFPKVKSNIVEVQARRGPVIALANPGADLHVEHLWTIPSAWGPFNAFLALPAMQLFSYEMADYLGKDVDQPRNLAKSVTVE